MESKYVLAHSRAMNKGIKEFLVKGILEDTEVLTTRSTVMYVMGVLDAYRMSIESRKISNFCFANVEYATKRMNMPGICDADRKKLICFMVMVRDMEPEVGAPLLAKSIVDTKIMGASARELGVLTANLYLVHKKFGYAISEELDKVIKL